MKDFSDFNGFNGFLFYFRFRPSRRPIPMPQPDYRIHEMNKRLQQRTDDSDNLWWDAFATEFFEDDANLTLTFCLEDGPKRYSKIMLNSVEYDYSVYRRWNLSIDFNSLRCEFSL